MDDDAVLTALGVALERDDPRLAALLRAGPTPAARRVLAATAPPLPAPPQGRRRRRPPGWVVGLGAGLTGLLAVLAALPFGLAVFGVLGLVLLVFAPLVACWWCATADEMRPRDG
jgi:hypothetical protein